MQIRVIDPLGAVRYDLYRATTMGSLQFSLPLAANDPPGQWTVTVKELLDDHVGSAQFTYLPAKQCGALAGATRRAVFFGNDRENIFRFIRTQQSVTIVKGTSDYCGAAAERLAAILKPWGVRSTIVAAAEVNKPRRLTADEAKTWVGLEFGRADRATATTPPRSASRWPARRFCWVPRRITRLSRRSARWASFPTRRPRTSRAEGAAIWPGSAMPSASSRNR